MILSRSLTLNSITETLLSCSEELTQSASNASVCEDFEEEFQVFGPGNLNIITILILLTKGSCYYRIYYGYGYNFTWDEAANICSLGSSSASNNGSGGWTLG